MKDLFSLQCFRSTAIGLVFHCLLAWPATAADWQITVVDPGGGGKYSSFHFDSHGNGHVVYVEENNGLLKYGFWDHVTNKWFNMVVDKTSGFASMALDSKDHPHISYLEYQTGRLKYAFWNGSTWIRQVIPLSARVITFYTSIALDLSDHPAITYYEYSGAEVDALLHLRIVQWDGRVWRVRTIDATAGSGKFNSLVRDAAGHLQVAYANVKEENHSMRYAYESEGVWTIDVLEGMLTANTEYVGYSAAIATDSLNRPHLVYFNETRRELKYATKEGGRWRIETVDNLVEEGYPDRNSIALDAQGQPYLAYYDSGAGLLKVAHKAGNQWVAEVVDSDFSGFTSSIQIANGEIAITYYDHPKNTLKWARRPLDAAAPDATKLERTKEASAQ
jgi:hypothetical protein